MTDGNATGDTEQNWPDQSPPDCSLCGDAEGIHWVPITNGETGETIDADLCDDCLEEIREGDSR